MNKRTKLTAITTFHNNPESVKNLANGFIACKDEFAEIGSNFVFINDSPDSKELLDELNNAKNILQNNNLFIEIINNEKSLGLVKCINTGLILAFNNKTDALLIDGNAVLFTGCVKEMYSAAYSDNMTAFVSPRSNNAGIASFPHPIYSSMSNLSADEAYDKYKTIQKNLPRVNFAPTAVGFCLYIRNFAIAEFGILDEIYTNGINAENDFILRANRYGYRAVLANYAYCGNNKKDDTDTPVDNNANIEILNARYNEYPKLINSYFKSIEYEAELLLSEITERRDNKIRLAFNLINNVHPHYNGSAEVAVNIIRHMVSYSDNFELHFITDEKTASFHELSSYGYIDPPDSNNRYAAIIHMGQPWNWNEAVKNALSAPVNIYFMLDNIAQDCGYLYNDIINNIWKFVFYHSNAVFYISRFSKEIFNNRYEVNPCLSEKIIYLSTHPEDYVKTNKRDGKYILIVGNMFFHKAIPDATKIISAAFPEKNIVVIGYNENKSFRNVTFLKSGDISEEDIELLYAEAEAVVFPSHYEGFGVPPVRGVCYGKNVLVRKSALIDELTKYLSNPKLIKTFQYTFEIPEIIKNLSYADNNYIDNHKSDLTGCRTWDDACRDIITAVNELIGSADTGNIIRRRLSVLNWFSSLVAGSTPKSNQ